MADAAAREGRLALGALVVGMAGGSSHSALPLINRRSREGTVRPAPRVGRVAHHLPTDSLCYRLPSPIPIHHGAASEQLVAAKGLVSQSGLLGVRSAVVSWFSITQSCPSHLYQCRMGPRSSQPKWWWRRRGPLHLHSPLPPPHPSSTTDRNARRSILVARIHFVHSVCASVLLHTIRRTTRIRTQKSSGIRHG